MKKLIKLVVCTFLIINMGLLNIYALDDVKKDEAFTRAQVKEDIDFMMKTLESVHPNLYFAVLEEQVEKEINKELGDIKDFATGLEVYKKFSPIINKFQDGHTGMAFPEDYITNLKNSDKLLFLDIEVKAGKIYIKDSYRKEYEKYNGWTIESINEKDASTIYEEIIKYISGSQIGFKESRIESNFVLYYYLDNELMDNYTIKVKNEEKEGIMKIKGISLEEGRKLRGEEEQQREDYVYKKIDDNTGLITFNSFSDFEKFDKFLDETFKEINEEKISNIIVDLRENGGGNSRLGDLLIEYIYDGKYTQANRMDMKISDEIIKYYDHLAKENNASEEEIQEMKDQYMGSVGECITFSAEPSRHFLDKAKFQGDVYFLIGKRTFSSAVMLSSTVKDYNMGYLIGEETGGLATHYGDLYRFTLPNTSLNMVVSHKYFVRPNGLDTKRGVLPDYDIKDLGERDALDIALKIIENKTGE
ncbi:S41 family peptidase [Maledivibacter halophilus]|uniref:Periplasmic protease n=1 Tax=Maledivibacter halophilus TaxID=36842 RepID=A0A1T5LYU7_9FIRM|nr:S41 family peptidase [Maledivibacter halophilus]SKC81035.1 Periplasmic protease [Maledivibacter halophilus]